MSATDFGQPTRRGVLSEGDRVQVRDPKGRFHQVILVSGGRFQSNRGGFNHNDVIGRPDGQVIVTEEGRQFQILRPLQVDYVMSMPRGAAVVYPKDAGVITHMGDIFPGATVVEAGAGSGACGVGEGVVVSIASQRSRAGVRREWEWAMGGHTEGNASGRALFHNPLQLCVAPLSSRCLGVAGPFGFPRGQRCRTIGV